MTKITVEFITHKMTNEQCLLVDWRFRIHKDWVCYDNDWWDYIPTYVFNLKNFIEKLSRKIYINEEHWCLNALDEFGNILYSPLNKNWIQKLDFDEWDIVDELDSEYDVEHGKKVRQLLSY